MSDKPVKCTEGKLRFDLLPAEALEAIAEVMTHGATSEEGRGDHNWRHGDGYLWGDVFAALMRHMWAWWRGEEKDPKSGLSHLAHAGANVLFLITYAQTGTGGDDRPKLS